MAEIKSTLDLVMERTRNLTMTEDDRRRQLEAVLRAGAGRLVQQYVESVIGIDKFVDELRLLETSRAGEATEAAISEIVKRMDPDAQCGPLLELLRDGLGRDVARIEELLRNYSEQAGAEMGKASDKIREKLRCAGISGSAVVPNPDCDEDLAVRRREAPEEFRKALDAAVAVVRA